MNPIRMREHWDAKVDGVAIAAALTIAKSVMVAQEEQRFSDLYQIEQLIKGVLATEVCTALQSPHYQAFGRKVYGCQLVHPGGSILNAEVALFLAQWKGRGLTESILIKVRDAVFSIPEAGVG
jgi:hypothetical protein